MLSEYRFFIFLFFKGYSVHELLWNDLVEKNVHGCLKMTISSLSGKNNCVSISREVTGPFSSLLELEAFFLVLQEEHLSYSKPFHQLQIGRVLSFY